MNYLKFLVEEMHTSIIASLNEKGHPITCAIDLMDYDSHHLYFLTARGKNFYQRLKSNPRISLTALKGESTLSCTAMTIQGEVIEIGNERVIDLFNKNTYMYDIYPTKESRNALTVFQINEMTGEWFDLSQKPIQRANFSFTKESSTHERYFVKDNCIGCHQCFNNCPQHCIDISQLPVVIKNENCLHCGNCINVCPVKAVIKI